MTGLPRIMRVTRAEEALWGPQTGTKSLGGGRQWFPAPSAQQQLPDPGLPVSGASTPCSCVVFAGPQTLLVCSLPTHNPLPTIFPGVLLRFLMPLSPASCPFDPLTVTQIHSLLSVSSAISQPRPPHAAPEEQLPQLLPTCQLPPPP